MEPTPNQSLDDWLNEPVEAEVKKAVAAAPRTQFPGVPTGAGVPAKPEPAPEKQKSLATLGITKGGVVRNATTTARSQLNNPIANPKPPSTRASSILDRGIEGGLLKEAPGIGVPAMMSEMDVNLEQRAKDRADRAQGVLPAAPADEPPPREKLATMHSSLEELIEIARINNGALRIVTRDFSLLLTINIPY